MKLLIPFLISGILINCTLSTFAQNTSAVFEVNQVRATMLSNGQLFTNGQTGQFIPVEPGLAEKSLLQGAGLWVVGKTASGNLMGAVQTGAQTNFKPGVLSISPPFNSSLVQGIWEISCSDIRQHMQDFADNGQLDNPNAAVLGWPGTGNPFFQGQNPGQMLPLTSQGLAGYSDLGPNIGTYDPNNGDAPSIEIRGCPLEPSTADKMAWFAFNDQLAPPSSGLLPIGLEVHAQVFAYTSSAQNAQKTIFVRYKIINRATEILEDAYVGVLADFGVGNPGDDFAGSDLEKHILFAYNGDSADEGGFETEIPAVGMTLLRGPLDETGEYIPVSHLMVLDHVDNLQPEGYYRILSGQFSDGTPAPNGGIMFAGNPNTPNSNSEISAGNTPGNRSGVASFGPFDLYPGAINEVIVAYSYAYSPGNSPAQNVELLLENAAGPKAMFDNCFLSSNNDCSFTSPVLELFANNALRIFPNPAASILTIESNGAAFDKIEVSNVLGQLIRSEYLNTPANNFTMPIDAFQNGVYMLRVNGQTRSIVVQR